MTSRALTGNDVVVALGGSSAKIPAANIPFGTTGGTVADGGTLATVASTASAANGTATGLASTVATHTASITTLNSNVLTIQQALPGYATGSAVTAQITTAIAPLASTATLNSTVAGLATTYVLNSTLSNYTTLSQLNSAVSGLVTTTALTSALSGYPTIAAMNAAITARLPQIATDGTGIHVLLSDGSIQNFTPASTTAAPGTSTFTLASATTMIPGTFLSLDAAVTSSQNALVPGTAGQQVSSTGDVLGVIEPINKTQASAGYGRTRRVTGGPGGFPFWQSTSASYNNAYDSLVLPNSVGAPMFSPVGGTWGWIMVIRQTGPGSSGIMKVDSPSGTHVYINGVSGASDGRLHIEQNNGAAVADEAASSLTALNQWQIITVLCDGSTLNLYRNGTRTLQTAAGTIGGFNSSPAVFEFLNNAQADVLLVEVFTGNPSIAEHNARLGLLSSRYSITVSTVTAGSATHIAPVPIDLTGTYLTSPNFPVSDTLPTISGNTPGNGLALTGGSTQMFTLRFGSGQTGANVLTTTDLYKYVYTGYLFGNQNDMTDTVNTTGTSEPKTYARARHYADGDANNLHKVTSRGLELSAIYAKNHISKAFGDTYAGYVRLPPEFKPGCVCKIIYQSPPGAHSWGSIWFASGKQRTPGPGGNPYANFGTNAALIRNPSGGKFFEIDMNDNYPRPDTGTPVGQQLDFAAPDIYGVPWVNSPPHNVYHASASGYTWFPSANPPHLRNANINWQSSMNSLVMFWTNDGSNLIHMFQNGILVQTEYMEFNGLADTYIDENGVTQTLGLHWQLSNEARATFTPGSDTAAENDGITDGWTLIVQEMAAWTGGIANPNNYRPA